MNASTGLEVSTLGGGCFWCLEAVFKALRGVKAVESGYSGGHQDHPTYQQVCSGATGHAEVVQITFDPQTIAFTDLLAVFFAIHDPTTLNRQGGDVGTQYRSVIYFHSNEQKQAAEQMIGDLDRSGRFGQPIVTEVEECKEFFVAEDDHHDYYESNRHQPYCRIVIEPKLAKLRRDFSDRL